MQAAVRTSMSTQETIQQIVSSRQESYRFAEIGVGQTGQVGKRIDTIQAMTQLRFLLSCRETTNLPAMVSSRALSFREILNRR